MHDQTRLSYVLLARPDGFLKNEGRKEIKMSRAASPPPSYSYSVTISCFSKGHCEENVKSKSTYGRTFGRCVCFWHSNGKCGSWKGLAECLSLYHPPFLLFSTMLLGNIVVWSIGLMFMFLKVSFITQHWRIKWSPKGVFIKIKEHLIAFLEIAESSVWPFG